MLQRLYNFVLLFKEYLILAGFVVLSLILLALNDNPQVKRIRALATISLGLMQQQLSFIQNYFGLQRENEILRHINVELADEANRLRDARLENVRLRQLLGLKEHSSQKLIAAKVVNKNLTLLRNTLTLDVGEADSVQPLMPVITHDGLVGIVVAVSKHYAVVNLLLNTSFRASAKVQRSRVDGIIAWDGKDLQLKNVAKTADIKPGDVVITSEFSSSYPPNIRIGIVTSSQEQPGSLLKTVIVTPSVDFVKLEEVFVLTVIPDAERLELERQAGQRFKK